jgi:streptogramin lyase
MKRPIEGACAKLGRAAILPLILGWAWISPPPARAQVGSLMVTMTSPTAGSTVHNTVAVSASVSPSGVLVQGVQFQLDGAPLGAEDTTAPYSVPWDTITSSNGPHTLRAIARDSLGIWYPSDPLTVTASNDVFVGLTDGRVLRHNPDGTLRGTLPSYSDGQVSSLAFDAAGNVYVPHWWGKTPGSPGNDVARYDPELNLLGTFGSGYADDPSSITFDGDGNVYVGQADGTGAILKFDAAGNPLATLHPAVGTRGTDHIDLARDRCTMFYTSRTNDVLRFDVCIDAQLPNFNTAPLPGYTNYHLRILPDGGVLVAATQSIVRLDASGNLVQTYSAPGEMNYWGGLDLVGDGTFWASNAYSAGIYRFDLQSGAVLTSFNTGTGLWSVAGVGVRP